MQGSASPAARSDRNGRATGSLAALRVIVLLALGFVLAPVLARADAASPEITPAAGLPGIAAPSGTTTPLTEAQLDALYPNHGAFVSAWGESMRQAIRDGFLLREDSRFLKVPVVRSMIGR